MAVMTDPQRAECNAEFMREISDARQACNGLTKADILAAVNALDQYLSDNAAAINSALPLPFRTSASTALKARLMKAVITKRYLTGA